MLDQTQTIYALAGAIVALCTYMVWFFRDSAKKAETREEWLKSEVLPVLREIARGMGLEAQTSAAMDKSMEILVEYVQEERFKDKYLLSQARQP